MRWTVLVVWFLAACDFTRTGGTTPGDDDDTVDGPPCKSFSGVVDTCTATFGPAVSLPSGVVEYRYDTDSHELERCISSGLMIVPDTQCSTIATPTNAVVNGVEVWFVESFTLAAVPFVVTGSAPFAIVARGGISIAGQIDMQAGNRSVAACADQAGQNGASNSGGGGGGGGGGFQRAGQSGGNGGSGGGAGGVIQAAPDVLIGGCPGGKGGGGPSNTTSGGSGGGALHLASAATVAVSSSGLINAGGRGGRGAQAEDGKGGGSGGGSGGMIWIEAPNVMLAGPIAANGGGGGEGSSGSNDGRGGTRGDTDALAASGGRGNDSNGGDGGDGDAGPTAVATMQGESNASGGGGGGGVGYIRIVGTLGGNGTVSPPQQ
jgi:hypothetical protein